VAENINKLIRQAQRDLTAVEEIYGTASVEVSHKLDAYASILREHNVRLLEAANLEARARAIRADRLRQQEAGHSIPMSTTQSHSLAASVSGPWKFALAPLNFMIKYRWAMVVVLPLLFLPALYDFWLDVQEKKAVLIMRRGDKAEALRLFTSMVTSYPKRSATWLRKAELELDLGANVPARDDAQKALKLNPKLVEAYATIARAQLNNGQVDEALQTADQGLSHKAKPHNLYAVRAEADLAKGEIADGLADCQKLLSINKNDPTALYIRGQCYAAQGDATAAVNDYGRALEYAHSVPDGPQVGQIYYQRSLMYAKAGQDEAAQQDLQSAADNGFKPTQLVQAEQPQPAASN
jgi:tetratricopeptide (TPR) repeat protein